MRNSPVAQMLGRESAGVQCMHCGIRMTAHMGSSGQVRYFRCASCHRWVTTTYTEVFAADTKVRAIREKPDPGQANFSSVKDRLERWLAALDDQDPYRTLGVSPGDSTDEIRARYHQLALERHPDRGGSAEQMQALNAAYERVIDHREGRSAALPALVAVSPVPAHSK